MLTSSTEKFKSFKVGRLVPESEDHLNEFNREIRSISPRVTELHLKDMPKVELGDFEISPLQEFLPKSRSRNTPGIDTSNYLYFVMQFPLNFYPDDFLIDNVRFAVNFNSNEKYEVKVADLYPKEKVEEVKRNVTLGISPSITFAEVSAKIFDLSFSFVYDEIRPIIYGSGVGRPHAYWNMRNHITHYIAGVKIMHVIIKVAKAAKTLTVKADLQATLRVGNRFMNVLFGIEDNFTYNNLSVDFDLKSCLPIPKTK